MRRIAVCSGDRDHSLGRRMTAFPDLYPGPQRIDFAQPAEELVPTPHCRPQQDGGESASARVCPKHGRKSIGPGSLRRNHCWASSQPQGQPAINSMSIDL
jgi:hypothetical protein